MSEHEYLESSWVLMKCRECGRESFEGRVAQAMVLPCRQSGCGGVMAVRVVGQQRRRNVVLNRRTS